MLNRITTTVRNTTRRVSKTKTPATTTSRCAASVTLTPEQRHRMIQEAAYFIAERRQFSNGCPTQDWLEAEDQIDRMLTGSC